MRLTMTALAAAALCAPAMAQAPGPAGGEVIRPKVSLAQAVATAERTLDAKAYDAEFDMDLGDLVYEIELTKDGRPMEAVVDAQTGRVLRHSKPLHVRLPRVHDHLDAAQNAPRNLSETIAMVEGATKGRVAEIGLERHGGRHYYEVELVGAPDREVLVDIRTGAIIPRLTD